MNTFIVEYENMIYIQKTPKKHSFPTKNQRKPSKESPLLKRWEDIISQRCVRVEEESKKNISPNKPPNPRNEYQRDFDRLIFSSAFRRLQNKTQVFPLPGTAQVHNRLTHSLEVSSVGRSLGSLVGNKISLLLYESKRKFPKDVLDFYCYELKDVILAACLAHDIGNPCFGHSGERIISDYFSKLKAEPDSLQPDLIELNNLKEEEWSDLIHFEGNANTLRILTAHYYGKLPGGLRLTYLTLASLLKYPWDSSVLEGSHSVIKNWGKKYGFFQEQNQLIKTLSKIVNLIPNEERSKSSKNIIYYRHPFAYLVEAADDICYLIMDMEDAQKISILSTETVRTNFWDLLKETEKTFSSKKINLDEIKEKENSLTDEREKIVYLRSKCFNVLTEIAADVFMDNWEAMVEGKSRSLLSIITDDYKIDSLNKIKKISEDKIYNHRTVSETMVGASKILPELLNLFLPTILITNKNTEKRTYQQEKIFSLINPQFTSKNFEEFKKLPLYNRILSLLDFITGMTDEYIIELYRKLIGIDRSQHS